MTTPALDESIRSSLDADGFCVLPEFLDVNTTHSLVAAFDELAESPAGDAKATSGRRLKRGVVFARRNLLCLDFIQRFIISPGVQELVDHLCPAAIAVRAILFDKTGDANWTVPWHQDRSIAVKERIDVPGFGPWSTKAGVVHVQPPVELLKKMVTLRFSLDACEVNNGPLRVIAGTHHRILAAAEVDYAVRAGTESHCTTMAGGVVIMRPLILHASSPGRHIGHRRVLHIEMAPPEVPGGLEWARA